MPTLMLQYGDDDTTPDRLAALAAEHGISAEMLAMRVIEDHLGEYGLTALPEDLDPSSYKEILEARGLLKKS